MKTIIAFFAARFSSAPSTDRAISGITKAIDELNAVSRAEDAVIDSLMAAQERARVGIEEATARGYRADRIAARFAGLIEDV